jgi:hypothetical protein
LNESRHRIRERIQKAQDNLQRLHDYIGMIKARPNQTLESSFQEEPARISFTDFPGELRSMIYELALFGTRVSPEEDRVLPDCNPWRERMEQKTKEQEMNDASRKERETEFYCECNKHSSPLKLAQLRVFSTLGVLNSLNRQEHEEARSLFWPKFWCSFDGRHTNKLLKFQQMAGLVGGGAEVIIPTPTFWNIMFGGGAGTTTFHGLGLSLGRWQSLQDLTLTLHISHIFGCDCDYENLQQGFLRGGELNTPHFERFATALESHPQLQSVSIKLIPSIRESYGLFAYLLEPFGIRERALYPKLYKRLNANYSRHRVGEPRKLGGVVVWLEFPTYLDHEGEEETG